MDERSAIVNLSQIARFESTIGLLENFCKAFEERPLLPDNLYLDRLISRRKAFDLLVYSNCFPPRKGFLGRGGRSLCASISALPLPYEQVL
jgi:hypothetical protein